MTAVQNEIKSIIISKIIEMSALKNLTVDFETVNNVTKVFFGSHVAILDTQRNQLRIDDNCFFFDNKDRTHVIIEIEKICNKYNTVNRKVSIF